MAVSVRARFVLPGGAALVAPKSFKAVVLSKGAVKIAPVEVQIVVGLSMGMKNVVEKRPKRRRAVVSQAVSVEAAKKMETLKALEIIEGLQRGEDVERTLAPYASNLTQEEWSKVLAQAGDRDWELAVRVFHVLKTQSAFAVNTPLSPVEGGEERKLAFLKLYTAFGAVLAKHGREVEIEALIGEMRSFGLGPDAFFFNVIVRGYGTRGFVHLASRVLIQMDRHGVQPNTSTYDSVIGAYLAGEKPQVEKAMRLLQGVRASNIIVAYKTLSKLLNACWAANKVDDADVILKDMKAANYNVDNKVWVKLMQLHGRRGSYKVVEDLIQQMREAGVEVRSGAYDALLLSYCRAGKPDQALSVFREYKLNMKPSFVAYNMLIGITGKAGRHEEAMQLYVDIMESGLHPTTVTYTSLIDALTQAGRYEKADEMYQRMLDEGLTPTPHTISTIIHANALRGWTKVGHEVYSTFLRNRNDEGNSVIYGGMLDLYVKGRWYSHAANILSEMENKAIEPDMAGYGTLISACGEHHDEAFAPLAKAMECSQFEPCRIAFSLVCVPPASDAVESSPPGHEADSTLDLAVQGYDIAVEQASTFFKHYALSRGIEPNVSFYNALLDALWISQMRFRAKLVMLKARDLVEGYPRPKYNETVWSLDLRSLSTGASGLALLHWLVEVSERAATCPIVAPRLVLLTGGSMVTTSNVRPFVGRGKGIGAVKQATEELLKRLGVPFTRSGGESGPAKLQAQTEQVVRWVSMYKDLLQLKDSSPS